MLRILKEVADLNGIREFEALVQYDANRKNSVSIYSSSKMIEEDSEAKTDQQSITSNNSQ